MKLGNLQAITEILNPLLEEKCPVKLSLNIMDVINEIQPELEKVNKVKQNLIDQYSIKDEEGKVKTRVDENGSELYDFGENETKVNEEMLVLMNTDVEIDSKIEIDNFSEDLKIEPVKLKILYDLGLLN